MLSKPRINNNQKVANLEDMVGMAVDSIQAYSWSTKPFLFKDFPTHNRGNKYDSRSHRILSINLCDLHFRSRIPTHICI